MSNSSPQWYAVYTSPGAESSVHRALQILGANETLLPVFGEGAERELLFPNYVLFCAKLTTSFLRRLSQEPGMHYILGAREAEPSSIPEREINLVKELMRSERHPILGSMPERGRIARVIDGPLIGIEGLVLWRNRNEARIGTEIQFLGRPCHFTIPLEQLALREYESGAAEYRKRHRGGRRQRRALSPHHTDSVA